MALSARTAARPPALAAEQPQRRCCSCGAVRSARRRPQALDASSVEPAAGAVPGLGRRGALQAAALAPLLQLLARPRRAAAEPDGGGGAAGLQLQLYANDAQQYRLSVPAGWERKDKAGADVLFEDPGRRSTSVGVTVSPVRVASIEQFGGLDAVGQRLLGAERKKESTLGVELLSSGARRGSGGASLYDYEYSLASTRGAKRILNTVTITGSRLYILNASVKCDKDDAACAAAEPSLALLRAVAASFDAGAPAPAQQGSAPRGRPAWERGDRPTRAAASRARRGGPAGGGGAAMGLSDPGTGAAASKHALLVAREVVASYTYVLIWMAISIGVILFNKWLLAYSGFPFPIALTLWHMTFCSAVGFVAVRLLRLVPSHSMTPREYATRVMPIGLLYAGSLWLSNSAYLYLSVSFIQMTKSLMPGLVYAAGCALGTEAFRPAAAANMALIAAGVVVCALGEVNLVLTGLLQQLTALGFEAMRLTLVQVLINAKGYNMNPLQSLYYVSPACGAALLVPFVAVEWPRIARALSAGSVTFSAPVLLSNALAAFALNLAVFLLIGKTSALTMNIAGVIKDWMLIFASYALFHAPVTRLNLAGYAFCCSGVVVYNHAKLKAIKARLAASAGAGPPAYTAAKGAADYAAGGGGAAADLERPLLAHRTKDDLLGEIARLQEEVERLDGVPGARGSSSALRGLGGLGAISTGRLGGGGSSSSSSGSSPSLGAGGGGGKLEHRSPPAGAPAPAWQR
ncbi:putative sugar phosphate/phosphate translocator [Scenedesmus sp. PABB004]|nr:putative sugar phosphate/phosphate translocator [Scenedesmus sp. PABB004]